MLSRKQLKAMSKCNDNVTCMNCIVTLTNCYNCNEEAAKTALELFDKVEAQEKEIEQLKRLLFDKQKSFNKIAKKLVKENEENSKDFSEQVDEIDRLCGECTRLSKENDQLKAQNATMREALENIMDCVDAKSWDEVQAIWILANNALSTEPIEYHNPADVEALKQAKEALKKIQGVTFEQDTFSIADKAYSDIDKVIGGGQSTAESEEL